MCIRDRLATGIVTAAASVGYFLAPLFTKYSLGEVGWQETFKYFMYFVFFGAIASLFLLPSNKNSNILGNAKEQTFLESMKEAFSHKGYILLLSGFFVCGFQITLVGTHIPGYMQDRGMDGWPATIILALIGLFNIVGTLGMGYLGTKYKKKILLSLLYASRAVILSLIHI